MAVSRRLRFEILRRDDFTCRYCGAKAPEAVMTVDHVVPVALGGSDEPSNLVAACDDCNGGKTSIQPGSPLVADVAADAVRWSHAMRAALADVRADWELEDRVIASLDEKWQGWHLGDDSSAKIPRPSSWRESIRVFLRSGLSSVDLSRFIDISMHTERVKGSDTWRYFCGCCWRALDTVRERAVEIADTSEPVDDDVIAVFTSAWRNCQRLTGRDFQFPDEDELGQVEFIVEQGCPVSTIPECVALAFEDGAPGDQVFGCFTYHAEDNWPVARKIAAVLESWWHFYPCDPPGWDRQEVKDEVRDLLQSGAHHGVLGPVFYWAKNDRGMTMEEVWEDGLRELRSMREEPDAT